MKNPKWKCAYPNSHKVKFGGKFLTQWDGYHLTLEQYTGGTISADKLKGYQGQSANLSYTANQDYYFNGWQSTGANIQNNQVPLTQNTTAKGSFVYTSPVRVIHTKSTNKVGNSYGLGSYVATVGSDYNLGSDYIIEDGPASAHGWSAEYLSNIEAIHFKFKSVPITLEGSKYLFAIKTYGEAAQCNWDGSQWTANQSDYGQLYWHYADTPYIASNNDRDGISDKKLATMSANRFPTFSLSHAKTYYVNSTYAENINGTIYAKCNNWTTGDNDIKYMIRIASGPNYDRNYDRTCFVSAYYNNNFVGSAWQGLYQLMYRKFYAYFGLFSATNNRYSASTASHGGTVTNYYDMYLPVAGSSQFDIANFSNIDNAKLWLENI